MTDPRRRIPSTDELLTLAPGLNRDWAKRIIHGVQARARAGEISPEDVRAAVTAEIGRDRPCSLRPVLNATGVIVHTNLGRAPLSAAAREAILDASGYVDVELNLATGARAPRGAGARRALLAACPEAGGALIVNNGAAALILAVTALATAASPEIVVSRGELVEIGGGFRLPELLVATGARLREVGTTNRTHPADYTAALGTETAAILKVHPSNFWVGGFTTDVCVGDLVDLAARAEEPVPVIADIGSGLLTPDPLLPDEPDVAAALAAGADLVIVSGDKLLGGPQAGILLGGAELIDMLARHPLARAVRADKLTYAALEATLSGTTPVTEALHADPGELADRTHALARVVAAAVPGADLRVVAHDGHVGGGGAPGVPLPGWALALPERLASALRGAEPAVLARTHQGACLVDLRCIPRDRDEDVSGVIIAALAAG